MQDDEEAQDVIDVQPSHEPSRKAARPFPWVVLVLGIVVSAIIMAAITISTVPLSIVTAH
jgi:cobalamin synthase